MPDAPNDTISHETTDDEIAEAVRSGLQAGCHTLRLKDETRAMRLLGGMTVRERWDWLSAPPAALEPTDG